MATHKSAHVHIPTPREDAARMLRRAARLIDRAELLPTRDGEPIAPATYKSLMSEARTLIHAAEARL